MKGALTISRWTNGKGESGISINFIDDSSGVNFLTAKVSLEDFAEAVTGLGHVPCTFELHSDNVGKRSEHKTELVPAVKSLNYAVTPKWKKAMIDQMKVFEVDGWKGRESDLWNRHNYVSNVVGEFQSVTFNRFVE